MVSLFFFFNDTATTEIYTLSLHDALPISNPLELRNFLKKMPKGADLHNHLAGAVYAESWIRAAADDHLCIDPAAIQGTKSVFSANGNRPAGSCGDGKIPAADIYKDQNFYDELIDAFSMRGFV